MNPILSHVEFVANESVPELRELGIDIDNLVDSDGVGVITVRNGRFFHR